MSTIDWSALKKEADDAIKPLDEGDYDLLVEKSELKFAAKTGAPMVVLQMKVVNGPKSGRIVFTNIVFSTDKAFALAMWFKKLAAFGLDDAYFARGPELDDIAVSLLGRYVTATLGIREWNDTKSNDVSSFKPTIGAIQPNNLMIGGGPLLPGGGPTPKSAFVASNTVPSVPSPAGVSAPQPGVPAPTTTPGSAVPGPSTPPPVAF
jgi:hypothetical protein